MAGEIDLIAAKQAIQGLDELYKKLIESDKVILKIAESARVLNASLSALKTPAGLSQLTADNSALTEQLRKQSEAITALQEKIKTLSAARQKNAQQTVQESVNNGILNRSARQSAIINSTLAGAYQRLSAEQAKSAQRVQDLIVRGKTAAQTQRQYNAELERAQKDFGVLNTRVLAADRAVGRFNRNVGNYPTQAAAGLRSLLSAFGVVGGVMLFARVMKDAFNVVADFDKANRDLAATMGVQKKDIQVLTDDQKRLGAATKFTATEVAGLQKEFAKLGFSKSEILNSTEATLNLASAVDTDLANAALVAGSTLRAFNLDASEMGRVTDVMASSFTKSALGIENFRESIKYVAPVAAASNITIEQTTALLSILADNGIKGSMAGTSLRRIMVDLTKTGKPFNEALAEVTKNGISVKDAFDEVGRTAQTSLLILGKNTDKITELNNAYEKAGGTVFKMANEQLKSLPNQIALMTSAWDGLILSFENSEGTITRTLNAYINGITIILTALRKLNETDLDLKNEEFRLGLENTTEYFNSIEDLDKRKKAASISIKESTDLIEHDTALLKLNKEEMDKISNSSYWSKIGRNTVKEVKILEALNAEYSKSLGYQEGRLAAAKSLLDVNVPVLNGEGDGSGKPEKEKKSRIQLNFDYIKSEFQLKKAILERQLAQINDDLTNEDSSLDARLRNRKIFAEKSIELMMLELSMAKAINLEKAKDDKEKNDVALKNKTITQKEHSQNVIDINRNTTAQQGIAETAFSEKYRNLINEDLSFYKKIEDEKREFNKKTKELILTSEKEKYKRIADDNDKIIGVRQKAFEEYVKLVKKELDLNEIRDLASAKSAEEIAFITEKYKELNAEINKQSTEESPEVLRMKELTKATAQWFKDMQAGFLDKSGLGSINFFTQLDEFGQSTFDKLIEGAQTTGEKMAIAFQGFGDVAQEVFSFINEVQENQYEENISRLDSQRDLAIQSAGDGATAKEEIERQYEERRKKIERKKAEDAKKSAIFNVVIDTAQAVVGALAEQNYAGAILFGIIGAAQLAMINSQEIPAFAEGGIHTKGGNMLINDAKGNNYKETVVTPDGNIKRYSGRNQVVNAPKGTEIFTPEQWEDKVNSLLVGGGIMPMGMNAKATVINQNGITMQQLERVISKIPTSNNNMSVNIDESGFMTRVTSGGQTRNIMNSRLRMKNRNV